MKPIRCYIALSVIHPTNWHQAQPMPASGNPTIAHYRSMLADFEYELKVETRRQGPSVLALQAAIERTRNTLSALVIRRGAESPEAAAQEQVAANDCAV